MPAGSGVGVGLGATVGEAVGVGSVLPCGRLQAAKDKAMMMAPKGTAMSSAR